MEESQPIILGPPNVILTKEYVKWSEERYDKYIYTDLCNTWLSRAKNAFTELNWSEFSVICSRVKMVQLVYLYSVFPSTVIDDKLTVLVLISIRT
jgi:hypothetical protein